MDSRELYGLPLDRFTKERNLLVKSLRVEGRREEGAEVSKLRKPSVAAWAVNQLVRTQPKELAALFAAGDTLQKAQADLLTGEANPAAVRKAVDAERAAVDGLADKVRGLLGPQGHGLTGTTVEQVSDTLHAGALDEEARAQLREGCLERELRHVGLGAVAAATTSPARTPAQRSQPPSTTAHQLDRERGAQDHAARLRAARKLETQARRRLDRAARGMEVAEQRRNRAVGALAEAEAALTEAREIADAAALEHRRAKAALDPR